ASDFERQQPTHAVAEERHLFFGIVGRLDHLANLVGKIGNCGKGREIVITTAPRIANGDASDIAGKGFGERNVKLCRSPGVRKDVQRRWPPSHAATIQSPTRSPGQGAALRSAGRYLNDVQVNIRKPERRPRGFGAVFGRYVSRFVYRRTRKKLTISPPSGVAIALGEIYRNAQLQVLFGVSGVRVVGKVPTCSLLHSQMCCRGLPARCPASVMRYRRATRRQQ